MALRELLLLSLLIVAAAAALYHYSDRGVVQDFVRPAANGSRILSADDVNRTLVLMDAWLVRDLNAEGYFDYEYRPSSGNYSRDNNMIRQLMAARTLGGLASADGRLMGAHGRNMRYVFSHWYRRNGSRGYIFYDNDSRLGANGMALRAISSSPLFGEYRGEAEALKMTIISLQNPNGSFRAYYVEPQYAYDEGYALSFYSGEAILGLLDYYSRSGDRESFDAAVRAQDYYVGEYADRMDDNYCPFYVPWHTMSLYRLHNITGEERYADAAFKLNDRLVRSQEQSGRFSDIRDIEYGQPHSAVVALYVDGLTYAYELALEYNDTTRARTYGRSISRGLAYLIGLQDRDEKDARVFGALKADTDDDMVRLDATQHSIDAFRRALMIYTANTNEKHGSG